MREAHVSSDMAECRLKGKLRSTDGGGGVYVSVELLGVIRM